jgi:hypothetical protein
MPTKARKSDSPKIVLWDIETTHNLAAVFKLFGEDYIPHTNIVQERYVVCASWKTLGEKKVYAVSTLDDPALYEKDPHNDLHVVTKLHEVLSDADVIVGHNGDKYDIKFTEGRMLYHGLPPLPPIVKIDTLKEVKNRFLLNSNRLDYIGSFLGVGQKRHTSPGLWLRVLKGDPDAVREMVTYNKQDVRLLERVFLKLQPYMASHVNRHLFADNGLGATSCPRCGSSRTKSKGLHRTITQVYQRRVCLTCGGWFRNRKAEKPALTDVRVL